MQESEFSLGSNNECHIVRHNECRCPSSYSFSFASIAPLAGNLAFSTSVAAPGGMQQCSYEC